MGDWTSRQKIGMGKLNGTDGLVGISPRGDAALVLALGASAGGAPALRRVEMLPFDRANPELLRKSLRDKGLRDARFALLLESSDYQLLQADAPAVDADEMREALRWQIKDSVAFPVDQATIDFVELPARSSAAGRPKQMLVVAAPHATLRPWIEFFQDAHADLVVIDVPELAQRNLAARFESGKRGFVFLNFDGDGGMLTFLHDGELIGWRRLDATLSLIAEVTPDRQESVFDRIALELQRSVDNFERQSGGINIGRLALLKSAGLDPLLAHLEANMSVPVEFVELGSVVGCDIGLPAGLQPGHLATLCGVALRAEA